MPAIRPSFFVQLTRLVGVSGHEARSDIPDSAIGSRPFPSLSEAGDGEAR
jgi:hypothetical protein